MSKEYKAIKNYIHNELGLTKEDIINAIRSDIRQYVEKCMNNTYGDDNNIKRWIEVMVENKLKQKDFNVIPRTVEKVLRDKMLDNIEIIVRNKYLNKNGGHEPRDMAGGSGTSPRRAMDASRGGAGVFLWID